MIKYFVTDQAINYPEYKLITKIEFFQLLVAGYWSNYTIDLIITVLQATSNNNMQI